MAKLDKDNRAKFWVDHDLAGVSLLRASFGTLSFAPHVHDELVVAVTEDGAGRFITRGISDVGTSRSIMVFNPDEPHSGGVASERGWHYRGLYVGAKVLQHICETIDRRANATPYFRNSVLNDSELAEFLVRAHLALEDRDARLIRESLFVAAFVKLFERHGEPRLQLAAVGYEQGPVLRALDYMRANFAADLTIYDLASCAALSPFHFARSFRKVTGLPPHAYLIQLRLNQARRLLADGKSPTEAALTVGFYDQSHLTNHFKRTYGITPGQYAKALL
ncbi:MAG: helix-turn-helix domain-containing protein [Beijerinckiaceae bacterium]